VLLGDTLELRHGPWRDMLAAATPALAEIGAAMAGGEIVLVPGNHDHALAGRALEDGPDLGLERRFAPEAASPIAAAVAAALAPARVAVAYPGLWIRDDVYATHGHYLDVHTKVPIVERLAAGVMRRLAGAPPADGAAPADYEAVLAPLYAWSHAAAQRTRQGRAAGDSRSPTIWKLLTGSGRRRSLRARALRIAFPLAVRGLNRAGIGPLEADISGEALRRGGLAAMREAVRSLGIAAPHVIFGHTHRTGPLPADDPAEWGPLHNTGSWVLQGHFVERAAMRGPYWPGGAILVEDGAPPRLLRLLDDVAPEALRAPGPA